MKTSELFKLIEDNWDILKKYPVLRLYVNLYRIMLVNVKPENVATVIAKVISYISLSNQPELFSILDKNNYIENGKLNLFLDINYNVMSPEALAKASQPDPNLVPPTTIDKIKSLSGALKDYAVAGFKNCTEEQYQQRLVICRGCEFFDPSGYMGAGKCNKCGCSGLKLKMGTSRCPIGKWEPVV